MKKVCIVTLYGNSNLGNKLQHYAVQQKCSELDCNVKSVKIYTLVETNNKKTILTCIVNNLRRLKHSISDKYMFINKKFIKFQREKLLMDKYEIYSNESNKRLNKKYDCFIVGSDQVWNPEFGLKGDLRFLEFTSKNKIAFSASIGVNEIPEELKEEYVKGLKGLDYISVREERAKEIVIELTGRKDIEVLIDPTMMLSKEKWDKIAKRPTNMANRKYILTYFLGDMSNEIKESVENCAKENNLEIIDVMENGNPKSWVGPAEFVYLEKHAELICTDSFHSCVFGILMQTPFVVFDREDHNKSMNSRIETLLSKFKMEDRKNNGEITEELLYCDFSRCEDILKEERKKADDFLRKALNIRENGNE